MLLTGCGSRIRTNDLRVMSPTSYPCSTPRYLVYSLECLYIITRSLMFVKCFLKKILQTVEIILKCVLISAKSLRYNNLRHKIRQKRLLPVGKRRCTAVSVDTYLFYIIIYAHPSFLFRRTLIFLKILH